MLFRSHTTILREGDDGRSMFFLAEGEVKVTKQGRLLNVLRAGDCFGEMGYIRQGAIQRQATVESMTELILADFGDGASGRVLSDSCEKNLVHALLNTLVERLMLADARLTRVMN